MKHRLAMVGFGGMAGWHYDLIQRIDDLEVAGIWDIKEERRTYAEGKGIHVYKSEEDLMADPTVDIVLVATPNDVHKGRFREACNSLLCGSCRNARGCGKDRQILYRTSESSLG